MRPVPALEILEASDFAEARLNARLELEQATPCDCCDTFHDHLVAHLGSVLFLDDNPHRLAASFVGCEHPPTVRQLAAAVVLYGRERVELYPHHP
ncbi:MAG: hypothetical protein LC659_01140 [Myxococcales bacterium]|nr:hypothetical protein [Myxococcales bacterium]